jgi:hypothetical protein
MSACKRAALILWAGGLLVLATVATAAWQDWPVKPHALGIVATLGVISLVVGAALWFSPGTFRDSATPALTRRYYREFAPPMIFYFLVMTIWKPLLRVIDLDWLRMIVALLPGLLVILAMRATMRYVRDSDEMQRRIELESVGIAAGIISAGYMTAGFLQSANMIAIDATSAMLWVFPALCLCYGVAKIIIARRYA